METQQYLCTFWSKAQGWNSCLLRVVTTYDSKLQHLNWCPKSRCNFSFGKMSCTFSVHASFLPLLAANILGIITYPAMHTSDLSANLPTHPQPLVTASCELQGSPFPALHLHYPRTPLSSQWNREMRERVKERKQSAKLCCEQLEVDPHGNH